MIRRIIMGTLNSNEICSAIDGTSLIIEPPLALDPTPYYYSSYKNKESDSHYSVDLVLEPAQSWVLASTVVTEDGGSHS